MASWSEALELGLHVQRTLIHDPNRTELYHSPKLDVIIATPPGPSITVRDPVYRSNPG